MGTDVTWELCTHTSWLSLTAQLFISPGPPPSLLKDIIHVKQGGPEFRNQWTGSAINPKKSPLTPKYSFEKGLAMYFRWYFQFIGIYNHS